MNKTIITILVSLLPTISLASDIYCPDGSKIRGETTPEAREAWCELSYNNKTVLHGPYRTWYQDNTIWVVGQYNKGVMVGQWFVWDKNGKLKSSDKYRNGVKNNGTRSKAP